MEMYIDYEKKPNYTTKGFLACLTSFMSKEYNLWRVFNQTGQITPEGVESGRIYFILEDKSEEINRSIILQKTKKTLSNFLGNEKIFPGITIKQQSKPYTLSVRKWEETLQKDYLRQARSKGNIVNDIFISYAEKDYIDAARLGSFFKAKGLTCFIAKDNITAGQNWPDEIRKGLRTCLEMCVLWTKNSCSSLWVSKEVGAAWMVGVPITWIRKGVDTKDLPDEGKQIQSIEIANTKGLNKYIERIISEKKKMI
jgi:hypothetical protein